MKTASISPIYWSLENLLKHGEDVIHGLALKAAGTVTSYRLVLGRCLLAVHQRELYKDYGCSNATNYGVLVLGLSKKESRTLRRVALRLRELPRLRGAAENGQVSWSQLREVVSVASPETEGLWLELCLHHTYHEIEKLVRATPYGGLPGDARGEQNSAVATELRCQLEPEALVIVERGLQSMSQEAGKVLSLGEAMEYLFAEWLAKRPLDEAALDKARAEARKDLVAEKARQQPLVREARELAAELGVAVLEGPQGCPARDTSDAETWAATTAAKTTPCPSNPNLSLLSRGKAHWQNTRLRHNPEARHTTVAQKKELVRRDGYQCCTPGCTNHLWLEAHHIKFYQDQGKTVPANLLTLCSRCHRNVHEGKLVITGEAPNLCFRDARGRRLDRDYHMEVAGWLNFHIGWTGEAHNCHKARVTFC